MKKRILALTAILVLALALTACGEKGYMVTTDNVETGGFDISCEKAGTGTGGNGYVTIAEGQCLVISPNLEKGSIKVKAFLMEREATAEDMGIADEASLDETISGRTLSTYDLEPGEYMLTVTSESNPTGTMMILPYDAAEIQAQDEALQEELAKLGVSLEEAAE